MFGASQNSEYIDIKKHLQMVDQENLFHKYTGIYPDTRKQYLSLFRTDRNPGCRFLWHSGILYFKDNRTYNSRLYFDIVDVVSILYNCSVKDAINIIMKENELNVAFSKQQSESKSRPEIRFKYKQFEKNNLFQISPEILESENVYLVTDYWIKRDNVWEYNPFHNPKKTTCIAYYFPHNGHVKLYFPEQKTIRFFTNCDDSDVYGMYKLDEYLLNPDFLIITKSQKDRLLLDYVYGYKALAVQSESSIDLPNDIIEKINKFNQKVILFDYDYAGQMFASKLSEKLNVPWMNLDIDKDVYDATLKFNKTNVKKYINQRCVGISGLLCV